MRSNFRTFKASIIMFILLSSAMISFMPSTSAKLITYESVLELDYDQTVVNNATFQPDGPPVSIPITIKFKVELPKAFLENIVLRLLFLQTFIITSARVKLTVLNDPDWAAVSITNPNPYVDISTEFMKAETSVVVAPHDDAPAEGFKLSLKAETDPLLNNHVPSRDAYLDIVFQPGYYPLIDVQTENPSRVVGPQDTATFIIKITNHGNKQTLVTARIVDYPEGWAPLLPQSQIIIPSRSEGNNVGEMSFSITPPYGFGWHNELETITLEFTPEFSPPQPGQSAFVGTPVPFQVTMRSRGFSTPGFEGLVVFAALIVVVLAVKKFKHH